jgi:hypothetical protein
MGKSELIERRKSEHDNNDEIKAGNTKYRKDAKHRTMHEKEVGCPLVLYRSDRNDTNMLYPQTYDQKIKRERNQTNAQTSS